MPRKSQSELVANRLSNEGRFVDLRLDVVEVDENRAETGVTLISVGGRWDRRKGRYVEGEKTARTIQAHPGQVEFLEWFGSWLEDHSEGVKIPMVEDDPCPACGTAARLANLDAEGKEYTCHDCGLTYKPIYSALLAGGQRAGKTQVGTSVAAVAYALEMPGSIVWIVCPTDKDFEEVEDYLEDTMPKEWYTKLGAPWFRYSIVNGTKIVLRSAHAPQALKKGRADLIIGNEMQRMKQGAFAIMRARIADRGGLVIGLANPPDSALGAWVGDWAIEAQAGLRQSKFFYFDPFLNPFINTAPLLALRQELDDHTFEVEVMGKFKTAKGMVIHNWDRFENEKPPPSDSLDITGEVTRYFEGRAYDRVVGVDVQKHPYMAGVEYKFYENPLAMTEPERWLWCHMWIVGAVLLEGADEFDLANAWLEMGWDPERTLIVCDASGQWQFAERNAQKVGELRKKLGGRGSFDAFRSMGFRHIVAPERDVKKNPDILERVRTTTARVGTAAPGPYGQHFLFSDPKLKKLNKCIRNWPTRHGKPSRTSDYAHAGDGVTYPPIRFFPRGRVHSDDPGVEIISRPDGRRMAGW